MDSCKKLGSPRIGRGRQYILPLKYYTLHLKKQQNTLNVRQDCMNFWKLKYGYSVVSIPPIMWEVPEGSSFYKAIYNNLEYFLPL